MGMCYNSTVVNAPADKVWETVKKFDDLSWAQMGLKVTPANEKKAGEIGAMRVINDAFHETLTVLDDSERSFSYQITDGPGPVAKDAVKNYFGTLKVYSITDENKSYVLWTSKYDSSDDKAVGELCNPIYAGALKGLKATFA